VGNFRNGKASEGDEEDASRGCSGVSASSNMSSHDLMPLQGWPKTTNSLRTQGVNVRPSCNQRDFSIISPL
jgi:hypothetical protein